METDFDSKTRQIRLPMDATAASCARTFASETLERWECPQLNDEVRLVVSEVVTNAIIHARTDMTLTLLNMGDNLQIRVSDGDSRPPKLRSANTSDTGGRGIFLVEAICSAWGVDDQPPGKVVWLDISKDRTPV